MLTLQTAIECINYMVQYCLYEPNIDVSSIEEVLEDILDEEFETICEDSSPKGKISYLMFYSIIKYIILEVATILFKFVQLIKEGNMEECEIEYKKLPTINSDWLNQSKTQISQTMVIFIILLNQEMELISFFL